MRTFGASPSPTETIYLVPSDRIFQSDECKGQEGAPYRQERPLWGVCLRMRSDALKHVANETDSEAASINIEAVGLSRWPLKLYS